MTVSILETLGTMPNGEVARLDVDGLRRSMERWRPNHKDEEARRKETKKRLDLYKDRGRKYIEDAVDKAYRNPQSREWRKALIEFAEFQNVTKRVIRETSTVYSEPASRKLSSASATLKYKEFQEEVFYDFKLRSVNHFGNLTNDLLVWPVVKDGVPEMRVVTQDRFTAIPHPLNPLKPVMYVVDQFPDGYNVKVTDPHYLGMSEKEWVYLDKDWRVISIEEHGLDRMPALLWHRQVPDECLLDWSSGRDLVSAHLAVALLNVMMLKHQKGGTRVPYATGDTSNVPRNQAMDEESLIEVGEGVTLNTLDLGADPSSFIDATRAVIKQIAANYGIPESVFDLSYQATSGFEIELKRSGLREIRRDQILIFRPFEKQLADLWAVVLEKANSEWAYSTQGWAIDFGEIDTPQEPNAKLTVWKELENLGLINRIDMYRQLNPEATPVEAAAKVQFNMEMRLEWQRMFQAQQQPLDSNPREPGGQPRPGGRVTDEEDEEETLQ